MKTKLFIRSVTTLALCLVTTVVLATPVTLSNGFNFRETRFNAPTGFAQGEILLFGAFANPQAGTTVVGHNTNTGENRTLVNFPSAFPGEFDSFPTYTSARALGDWILTATNGSDSSTLTLPAFGTGPGHGPIPGVSGLTASGSSTAPLVSWTLPAGLGSANDGNVNRLRVRIQNADVSNPFIAFDSWSTVHQFLPVTQTSFAVPSGFITAPGNYVAEVLIEGFNPFTRSRTYSALFSVPEPMTLVLMGLGLLGLAARNNRHG